MAGEQGGRGLRARSAAGPGAARRPEAAPARPTVSPTYGRRETGESDSSSLLRGAVPPRASASPARAVPARAVPADTAARDVPTRSAAAAVQVDAARGSTASARAGAGHEERGRPTPRPRRRVQPGAEPASPQRAEEKGANADSRVAYVSVVEASRETGASPSAVRAWARDGQVRSRAGVGPRGQRTEVALVDVEGLTVERLPAPTARRPSPAARPRSQARRRRAPSTALAVRAEPEVSPGAQLVPMTTVEAMERLSGELYLSGQRAARAEAVAELRDRRLTDLQQEVDDLQRAATDLWEQNQELLRRVAVSEAQVVAMQRSQAERAAAAATAGQAGAGESGWRRLRR